MPLAASFESDVSVYRFHGVAIAAYCFPAKRSTHCKAKAARADETRFSISSKGQRAYSPRSSLLYHDHLSEARGDPHTRLSERIAQCCRGNLPCPFGPAAYPTVRIGMHSQVRRSCGGPNRACCFTPTSAILRIYSERRS